MKGDNSIYADGSFTRRTITSPIIHLASDDILCRKISMTVSGMFDETQGGVDPKLSDNNKRGAHKFQGSKIPANRFNQPRKR